jgi:hypothetical protein
MMTVSVLVIVEVPQSVDCCDPAVRRISPFAFVNPPKKKTSSMVTVTVWVPSSKLHVTPLPEEASTTGEIVKSATSTITEEMGEAQRNPTMFLMFICLPRWGKPSQAHKRVNHGCLSRCNGKVAPSPSLAARWGCLRDPRYEGADRGQNRENERSGRMPTRSGLKLLLTRAGPVRACIRLRFPS